MVQNDIVKIMCIRDSYMFSLNMAATTKVGCGVVYFTPILDIGASYLNWISVYVQYNGGYQFVGTFSAKDFMRYSEFRDMRINEIFED
jgi:hypothetical protein